MNCALNIADGYKRASNCIGLVLGVRVTYAVLLYVALRITGTNMPFRGITQLPFDWLYLFAAWDTGYYYSIAEYWYPQSLSPQWVFFPLYPAIVRALHYGGLDVPLGAFVVATIAGLASIPLLVRVAEKYLPRDQVFKCTLLYFLFPPVFVFSGVSYSDSLFLLLSLLTWNCHAEAKDLRASLVVGLCTLVRSYGILIALPLAYDFLRRREFRKLGYLAIPVSTLALWIAYVYSMTGSLAVLSARTLFVNQNVLIFRNGLIDFLQGRLSSLQVLLYFMWKYLPFAIAALIAILLVAFGCIKVWRIDRALCLYTMASLLIIVYFGFFPSFGSFPRYLGFIFPIALAFRTKRSWMFYAALITFLALSFVAWWAFVTDGLN